MFLIGDRVVHPMHGAGIIENIIEERLAGKLGRYYVFRMPVGGLVLKIPTDNCGSIGVRALSTAAQIEEIFHKIPSLPVEINSNWNRRYRENMERIKSGNLLEVARVIKTLMPRQAARALQRRAQNAPQRQADPPVRGRARGAGALSGGGKTYRPGDAV